MMENLEPQVSENNIVHESEEDVLPITSSEQPEQVEASFELLCAALDGLLLVQNKPISVEKLAAVLSITPEKAEEVVQARKKAYDEDENGGLQIAILENGVQLATKAKISQFIQRLDGQKLVSLSLPALETLSVIAFKQPITKAEIDAIRGVNCDGVVSTLLEKKLIYVSGEKQVLGKPRLYSTTQDFLYYFGMKSIKELPVPSVDIPEQLTPEGQREEAVHEQREIEKDFNDSQGLMPIEEDKDVQTPEN
ncbi:MAG: SMC-Scp complex subunit ScpB [Erysipelotrichia bacterium]|nr:SMC-Scp complex subunit ScpB [Candidatus Riflebacteria bacterium]NCB38711.1 SMC-Scp complex subunit ScpB [Erysipelotrichia bacterium]